MENRRIVLPIEPMEVLGSFVNPYFFIIIVAGCGIALGRWFFLHRTRYGKMLRAAVFSRDMVSALGIRIPAIYAGVFGLGVGLAALTAGIFLPIMPLSLGIDMDLIVQCFAVVVIRGIALLIRIHGYGFFT